MKEQQKLQRVSQNLYRNHLGTYFAIIKVRGKQIKQSLRTTDQIIAKNKLRALEADSHRLVGDRKILFSDLAERWLLTQKNKEGTLDRKRSALNALKPFLGNKFAFKITPGDVEKWEVERANKMSARTKNIELETLNAVLKYGIKHGVVVRLPTEDTTRAREIRQNVIPPTKEEFKTLVEELRRESKTKKAADFAEFLAYSGLRLDEGNEVIWADVNYEKNELTVTGGEVGVKNGKTETIPLFLPLKELLERLAKANPNAQANDRIFPPRLKKNGKQQGYSARSALKSGCSRAGLPDFTHHDMRHFFCSNAIEQGVDFATIGKWLRHHDGGILAAKTYGHLRQEHSHSMALKMSFSASSIEQRKEAA